MPNPRWKRCGSRTDGPKTFRPELLLHFEEFLRFFLLHAVQRHPGPLRRLNASQPEKEAAQRSWPAEVSIFWDFVSSSKRGICSTVRWGQVKGAAFNGEEE